MPGFPQKAKFRFIAPFGRANRNNGKWKMYNVKCRYPFGMDLKIEQHIVDTFCGISIIFCENENIL